MSDSSSTKSNAAIIAAIVASVVALSFAVLWFRERDRTPAEVIREVPKEVVVEKLREVPKVVIKEVEVTKEVKVPAKLTDEQQAGIEFTSRYLAAPMLTTIDEALYKLDSVAVRVFVNDAVKKVVTEDRLKNKFELILRKQNIRLDDKAQVWLDLNYEGFWDKDEITLYYSPQMRLRQVATIIRHGDFRRASVIVWQDAGLGFAGKKVVEEAILSDVEQRAEAFANKYLAIQDTNK
jgi:hypothetical protein